MQKARTPDTLTPRDLDKLSRLLKDRPEAREIVDKIDRVRKELALRAHASVVVRNHTFLQLVE